jgi:hypothetical protein
MIQTTHALRRLVAKAKEGRAVEVGIRTPRYGITLPLLISSDDQGHQGHQGLQLKRVWLEIHVQPLLISSFFRLSTVRVICLLWPVTRAGYCTTQIQIDWSSASRS